MQQTWSIAVNAFMELVRQPVYLLLLTCSGCFNLFLASVYYFGFGDDPKMVKDSTLAVMLLSGLFAAVLSAASSVAQEVRSGTALAVLSKPVARLQFLLAKYAGLAAVLALLGYTNLLTSLLASRMAYDVYGEPDRIALAIAYGSIVLGFLIAGAGNYFLRRPFVADAVVSVTLMLTLAFVIINFIDKHGDWQKFAVGVDWRLVPAGILVVFALWLLAGLALACSTRLEMVPTLAVCSGLFLLGLMSNYFFGRPAAEGSWWATVLYTVLPNWQNFWLADALEPNKTVPWAHVGRVFLYLVGYLGAVLSLALLLFEDRELK